jgi:hypothetical protein
MPTRRCLVGIFVGGASRWDTEEAVEHPFGTIKHQILGNARLLVRGMKGAQAELSLAVLAYNLKRVFNMKGANWMHRALQG